MRVKFAYSSWALVNREALQVAPLQAGRESPDNIPGSSKQVETSSLIRHVDFSPRTTVRLPQFRQLSETDGEDRFHHAVLIDTTPLPDSVPKVEEVGATSAPLLSASYFIGARCKDYNEDYMLCKHEAKGRGPVDCLREGRKVTRCASSV